MTNYRLRERMSLSTRRGAKKTTTGEQNIQAKLAVLTEELKKYKEGSPEYELLKAKIAALS